MASEPFSIAKVRILRTIGTGQPSEITNTTINTIVGERIKLAAEILPTGISVSSRQWTIPQKIMKDFLVGTNSSSVVAVSGLDTANADFVWYDGADGREVKYTAVAGGNLVGKATFNVKRPEASVITISTSQSFTTIDSATGVLELHYGLSTAQTAGIRFSIASITIPTPFTGDKQWVQTINRSATVTPVGGSQTSFTQTGLDGCYPYAPINQNSTFDSPGVQLAPFSYVNFNQQWSMWLMFKPSGSDSSWVPLRRVNWRWLAEAELISSSWKLLSHTNPNTPSQPTDADATEFPIWTLVVPSDGGC